MKATIWHNPRCSKSREALALLQNAGADVEVVVYLKRPPTRTELASIFERADIRPSTALRVSESAAKSLADADDDAILDAMAADPILIERPIVATELGVRIARPPERVLEIL